MYYVSMYNGPCPCPCPCPWDRRWVTSSGPRSTEAMDATWLVLVLVLVLSSRTLSRRCCWGHVEAPSLRYRRARSPKRVPPRPTLRCWGMGSPTRRPAALAGTDLGPKVPVSCVCAPYIKKCGTGAGYTGNKIGSKAARIANRAPQYTHGHISHV
jgi:hypothetical protein